MADQVVAEVLQYLQQREQEHQAKGIMEELEILIARIKAAVVVVLVL
jgi:hypothetical protein